MAILVKKLYDKVLEHLGKEFQFDELKTQDMRFAFFVYFWLVRKENKHSLSGYETKEVVRISYGEYIGLFGKYDKPKYSTYERAIYRKFKEYSKPEEYLLLDFIERLVKDM